jgi:membrane protein
MIFIAFLFYLLELFLVGVEAMSDSVLSKLFFDERVVNALLFILTNGTLITIVFKWVNEAHIPWKLAIRGALFTSIVLYLFQFAINYYLKTYFFLSNVNLVGVVFVLMAWVYYSAHILYFGAIITYFYGIQFNFIHDKNIK